MKKKNIQLLTKSKLKKEVKDLDFFDWLTITFREGKEERKKERKRNRMRKKERKRKKKEETNKRKVKKNQRHTYICY